MNHQLNYNPPSSWGKITTIDMHTAGEPLRILTGGLPEIKGRTILDKRRYFSENLDHIRTGVLFEPRGHADMYGAIITEPTLADSDFGCFFLHNDGYSTMCGHAVLALTRLAIESSYVKYDGITSIRIDTPAGQLLADAEIKNEKLISTNFQNVPAFVLVKDEVINVRGIGIVKFSIAYGGAFYAICDAGDLGLKLTSKETRKLIDYGRKIKAAISREIAIPHPFEEELGFLYGTIFVGKARNKNNHSRNVCVFADGAIDRSPTGSGVSARAALHFENNELPQGERITIESIIGTTMSVEIVSTENYGGYHAVIPKVSGKAFFTGRNEYWFDPKDPLVKGFIVR